MQQNQLITLQKIKFKKFLDLSEKDNSRIALALHDNLGPILSTAKLTLSSVNSEIHKTEVIQSTAQLLDIAVDNVRLMSFHIKPSTLQRLGFKETCFELLRKIDSKQNQFTLIFQGNYDQYTNLDTIRNFRIFQELVISILDLKPTQTTEITLNFLPTKFIIEANPIQNFSEFKNTHFKILLEKVKLFSGEINFDEKKNFTLKIVLS